MVSDHYLSLNIDYYVLLSLSLLDYLLIKRIFKKKYIHLLN